MRICCFDTVLIWLVRISSKHMYNGKYVDEIAAGRIRLFYKLNTSALDPVNIILSWKGWYFMYFNIKLFSV